LVNMSIGFEIKSERLAIEGVYDAELGKAVSSGEGYGNDCEQKNSIISVRMITLIAWDFCGH